MTFRDAKAAAQAVGLPPKVDVWLFTGTLIRALQITAPIVSNDASWRKVETKIIRLRKTMLLLGLKNIHWKYILKQIKGQSLCFEAMTKVQGCLPHYC
jgi:hypothetical protein